MKQKWNHPAFRRGVTGMSGTGKTTLFKSLIDAEKAPTKFFYDHQGEFSGRFGMQPCFDMETLFQQTDRGGNVCFDPVRMFPGRADEGFLTFCDYIVSIRPHKKGRFLVVTDELQKITDVYNPPEQFLILCDVGRRYQIDVYFAAQSIHALHNRIRNQLTEIYTFRQLDKNAVKPLEDLGFDAEKIRTLQNGEYIWRNLNTGESKQGGSAF